MALIMGFQNFGQTWKQVADTPDLQILLHIHMASFTTVWINDAWVAVAVLSCAQIVTGNLSERALQVENRTGFGALPCGSQQS